jgi:hypothetical protein
LAMMRCSVGNWPIVLFVGSAFALVGVGLFIVCAIELASRVLP